MNQIKNFGFPNNCGKLCQIFRCLSSGAENNILKSINKEYLYNTNELKNIEENIKKRKGVGNIKLVVELKNKLSNLHRNDQKFAEITNQLIKELLLIPNKTHPNVVNMGNKPKQLRQVGKFPEFNFKPKDFHDITKRLNMVRTEHLGNLSGNKSYYLLGELAELEYSIIKYFTNNLLENGFELILVPDILPRSIIENCGMNTRGERTQVYTLDPNLHNADLCLSGTSEIALAAYLADTVLEYGNLPLKLCSVSRCYRAETSSIAEERGIFRVHEFTKVEMFIVTMPEQSEDALEELRNNQEKLFESLGLHFKVLDMPPHELGAQAYRKYDIEAWMPGRNMYGEISSCSNCTDFQSRRLNITYKMPDGFVEYVHTLNGTACAIPRLLIALVETGQDSKGFISVPNVLQKHMKGKSVIGKQKKIPELKLIKNKKK
ncbi:serine--tRNA ligase, mitochondrial [Cylas formicarius]|uniref:serine--tRNA ligase, mitochondrial n=1 Tax=Cylas formicarius TaxID=197179 RepID=UPI00295836AA|nr:serine--tRNA ligase, mitochondrial [Cylas formicarius]